MPLPFLSGAQHTPAPAVGGSPAISLVGFTKSGNAANLAPHVDAVAGDWAFYFEVCRINNTITPITDWTYQWADQPMDADNLHKVLHSKELDAGDLGVGVASMAHDTQSDRIMLVVRPSGGTCTGITVKNRLLSNSPTPANQTISNSGVSAPALALGFAAYAGLAVSLTTNTLGLTEIVQEDALMAYGLFNSAPGTGDVGITVSGSTFNEFLGSCFVQFNFA